MSKILNLANYLFKKHIMSIAYRNFPSLIKRNSKRQNIKLFSNLNDIAFPKHTLKSAESKNIYETIKVSYDTDNENHQTGVTIVTLNREKTLNAFNIKMWQEFNDVFRESINHDKTVKVAILTGGSPKSFSTGMDLSVFMDIDATLAIESCEARKKEGLYKVIKFFQNSVSSTEDCIVPVLATASGHCIGGALDVFTACDLRYCITDTQFSIRETDLAMVADIGTLQRLPLIIGQQRARELAFTGRTFNGKEAEAMGLVLKCYDSYDEMMKSVTETARIIASKSPITIRGIKKTLLYAKDHNIADSLEQVNMHNCASLHSEDLSIAMKSYMSKKKPKYTGV